jgi:phospholipid-transporting ATPase
MKDPLISPTEHPQRSTTLIKLDDREIPLPAARPSAFPTNFISTCKYNLVTFLPKNLWTQFQKLANVYFLAAAVLQCIPNVTTSDGVPNILLPLLFVLIISGVKDALEDLKRRKSDKEENSRKVLLRAGANWVETAWQDLCVGDIVKVNKDESFPADLILLCSSEASGIAYVETKNLDGETNLKHKQAEKTCLEAFSREEALDSLAAKAKCQGPNSMIYEFSGLLYIRDLPIVLGYQQFLLRGSGLRNTDWVVGLAVYTGHETKIMLNSPQSRSKFSRVEQQMNKQIIYLFLLQIAFCLLAGILYISEFWATESATDQYLDMNKSYDDMAFLFIVVFLSWALIFTNFVPISLIVTLEMVKFFQAFFISWDLELYWAGTDTPASVQSSNLNEELGQINYVFSDKTGTLTQNVMDFRKLTVKGVTYGTEDRMPKEEKRPHVDFVDNSFMEKTREKDALELLYFLAVCHTLLAEEKDGELEYKASSPDELALVYGAGYFGVRFIGRDQDQNVLLDDHGTRVLVKILNIIEFNSDRKRMTVIAEFPDSTIKVLCKGADSVMLARSVPCRYTDITLSQLEEYASKGLRTLVYSSRTLSPAEYAKWNSDYQEAMTVLNQRERLIDELAERVESDLVLVGATAIEDKLQEKVPETIAFLRTAGIKVWVLTGDKVETAVNIGYSCALLTRDMGSFVIDGKRTQDVEDQMKEALKTISEEGENTSNALIVTGEALLKALTPKLSPHFFRIAEKCGVVLACRVSPQQKADIVTLVIASNPHVRALSIGDGANDVSMITAAHVGVGISGLEGQQAVRASDYAVGQFSFLKRLLFVHGRECYRRNATLICYNFYKNVLLVMPLFWYGFLSQFSGQSLYNMWTAQLFNLFYASIPIMIFALFDREQSYSELMEKPNLYEIGLHDQLFGNLRFWMWIIEGIISSIALLFVVIFAMCKYTGDKTYGTMENIWVGGMELYALIIVLVNLKVLMLSNRHFWFSILMLLLSIGSYFFTTFLIVEWMPMSELFGNWDMRHSSFRIFTSPIAYSVGFLLVVSTVIGFPVANLLLEFYSVVKQQRQAAKLKRTGVDLPSRSTSRFSLKRKGHADTGFAFAQEPGHTPQVTEVIQRSARSKAEVTTG